MKWWWSLLVVLDVGVTVAFIWHTELWLMGGLGTFSNGVIDCDPIIMYHALMYALFGLHAGILLRYQHLEG